MIVIAIITLLLILGLLISVHELGHFSAAKLSKVRVEEFGLGMFFRIFSFKRGETTYSLNALPIGGFVKITGEDEVVANDPKSFSEKPSSLKILILAAGVTGNLLLAMVLFSATYLVGMPNWGNRVVIQEVSPDSPALEAGISVGDVILRANETPIEIGSDLSAFNSEHLNETVALTIERSGQSLTVPVLVRENPPEGQGAIGVRTTTEVLVTSYEKHDFFGSIKRGFETTVETGEMIGQGLVSLFSDLITKRQAPSDVAGPVGIGQIIFELIKYGYRPILQFAAILSLNLAFINLIPIPALDGGRMLFVIIETITRKKIPSRVNLIVNATGMGLLLLLMAIITFRDIARLIGL